MDTSTADFDSHLTLDPSAAFSSASPPMSSDSNDPAADIVDVDGDEEAADDEQHDDDVQLIDDNAAHVAKKRPKRKAAAAAASSSSSTAKKAKLGKWHNAEDLTLLEAIKQFVIANKGQLPGPVRTVASAVCTKPWITIGRAVSKVNDLSPDAAGKACSARWTALRGSAKVTQTCALANKGQGAHSCCFVL